jgi:hypothetical protein
MLTILFAQALSWRKIRPSIPLSAHPADYLTPLSRHSIAVGAAAYSMGNKLYSDKTLRIYRNKPEDREH